MKGSSKLNPRTRSTRSRCDQCLHRSYPWPRIEVNICAVSFTMKRPAKALQHLQRRPAGQLRRLGIIEPKDPCARARRSDAVDLSRLHEGGIPLLDHHLQTGINSMLGRLTDAWFERGAQIGRFKFNQTPEGKKAEGMV